MHKIKVMYFQIKEGTINSELIFNKEIEDATFPVTVSAGGKSYTIASTGEVTKAGSGSVTPTPEPTVPEAYYMYFSNDVTDYSLLALFPVVSLSSSLLSGNATSGYIVN